MEAPIGHGQERAGGKNGMPSDLRCTCSFEHCCGRCHNRATQEDGRCDYCRGEAAQLSTAFITSAVATGEPATI